MVERCPTDSTVRRTCPARAPLLHAELMRVPACGSQELSVGEIGQRLYPHPTGHSGEGAMVSDASASPAADARPLPRRTLRQLRRFSHVNVTVRSTSAREAATPTAGATSGV